MRIRSLSSVFVFVVIALALPSPDARAAWPDAPATSGVPLCSRPTQELPRMDAVIGDGAGGTIVIWEDTRAGAADIYAQRLNGQGEPQWDTDGVPVCAAAGIQRHPRIVPDGAGGAIVAWEDARGGAYDIYAQRLDAAGVPRWGTGGVAVGAAVDDQVATEMISDGAGGAIVVWEDRRLGLYDADIRAQRLDAAGVGLWTSDGLSISTAVGREFLPTVVSDGAGGAFIAWASYDVMRAQHVSATGASSWTSGGVSVTTAGGFHTDPQIVHVGAGATIVVWEDQVGSSSAAWSLRAQKLNTLGARQWGTGGIDLCPQDSSQWTLRTVADGAGGAFVVWVDERSGAASSDIYAQRLDGNGALLWGASGAPVCTASGFQWWPVVTADGSGGVIIAWQDQRMPSADLYAQRLNSGGVPQWGSQGNLICGSSGHQLAPELIGTAGGGAVIAWLDTRQGSNDIFAQLVRPDGQVGLVPTLEVHDRLVVEGNAGSTPATFHVTLSWPTSKTVTVSWATGDGSATTADGDYVPSSGILTIPPAALSAPVPVSVNGDLDVEADETFSFTLASPTNATLGIAAAVGAILDDDAFSLVGPSPWATDGTVKTMVESGGTIYVGGSFSRMGTASGGGVPVDAVTWEPIALPQVAGVIYATAEDGAGGWYLGGDFSHVAGTPRRNLAHLRADYTVSAWNPMADGVVRALVRIGAVVYAGGEFTVVDGRPRDRLAAMDATGTANAWDPGANGRVLALAASSGTIYAGGEFTQLGGKTRNRIGAINAAGAVASWNPDASDDVMALAVSGNTVYAGGSFTQIGGQPRNRIAVMRGGSAAADPTWNPNAQSNVEALALSGATLYAGGSFNAIGGQPRDYAAALDTTSGLATPWNPDADHAVMALAVAGGTVYAGGSFDAIGGQPRRNAGALDAVTGMATPWNPDPQGDVFALGASGATVFVGGRFALLGGQVRNNLAALDAATGNPTNWDPQPNGDVRALAVAGQTVYAGGAFTSFAGGMTRNRVAALDAITGVPTAWNPGANGPVTALAVSGSIVYAGGSFTNIGGNFRNRLAALDGTGTAVASWNPSPNGLVNALAVAGSVFAGGTFTNIGGLARNRVAALSATSGAATAWNPNADGPVNALVVSGGLMYAGGGFNHIGGQARPGLAALNTAASGTATAWIPEWLGGVNALVVNGSTIYAGGWDLTGGGSLAALDAATGQSSPWLPSFNDTVRAVAVVSGAGVIHAGGDFTAAGGWSRQGMALIAPNGRVSAPAEPAASVLELALGPNPAASRVHLTYALPRASHARVDVYDVQGRLLERIVDREQPAGRHTRIWEPGGARRRSTAGIYFVRLEAAGHVITRRLVLLH